MCHQYPISELIRLLEFENAEEARELCWHFCLAVEEGGVVLDSKQYLAPEQTLPQQRSRGLVEAKCTVSMGQVPPAGDTLFIMIPG